MQTGSIYFSNAKRNDQNCQDQYCTGKGLFFSNDQVKLPACHKKDQYCYNIKTILPEKHSKNCGGCEKRVCQVLFIMLLPEQIPGQFIHEKQDKGIIKYIYNKSDGVSHKNRTQGKKKQCDKQHPVRNSQLFHCVNSISQYQK